MKIQSLAVIAIIILLPMTLILNSYTRNQIKTLDLQTSYDSKLLNSTYDGLKAFQINSANSDTSNIVESKIRNVEAASNSFFNSLASNFNLTGYDKTVLQNYVPAVVYTMYDGFYIYSPYINSLEADEDANGLSNVATYYNDEEIFGIKPYVYYSCRYVKDNNIDVVIQYSLDNYIVVRGTVGNSSINISGYLLSRVESNDENSATYRGVNIGVENLNQSTYIADTGTTGSVQSYPYRKIQGTKYYVEGSGSSSQVFTMINGKKLIQQSRDSNSIINNDSAVQYYRDAIEFKEQIKAAGIDTLTYDDAVDSDGTKLFRDDNTLIFEGLDNQATGAVDIEESTSNFNAHRREIIKYSIEKNLTVAISNFNHYSNSTTNFQMPKLKEEEWDTILNDISIISFLQGLNIGGKVYNGYAIVPNNKNKEVVSEDSIYIVDNNQIVHKATDTNISSSTAELLGVFNFDLERKSTSEDEHTSNYFFPYPAATNSYDSIVTGTSNYNIELNRTNMYDYIEGCNNDKLKVAYFTALARERQSMYRNENINTQ